MDENRRIQFRNVEQRSRCITCGEEKPLEQLDRQFWCDDCRAASTEFAARWGRIVGILVALGLAVWIGTSLQPSGPFLAVWAAVVLVAYRMSGRLARELIFSVLRLGRFRVRR